MKKQDDSYNGFTNRETWAVSLHIHNDQGLYSEYVDMLNRSNSQHEFAKELEDWFTELVFTILEDGKLSNEARGMVLDIGSLWRVDWYELASEAGE